MTPDIDAGQAEMPLRDRWHVRIARRYLGVGPYLDFGCGTGHLLRRLAARGSASGFAFSEYAAGSARETAPGCPVHTTLDGIPSGVFRVVTAVGVLGRLDDDAVRDVLACWRRVLVPGGGALVVVPDAGGRARELAGESWSGHGYPHPRSHAQWRRVVTEAGFTVLREGSDGLWNVPYGRLPGPLDAVAHAVPSLTQFLSGRLFLKPGSGESSVFVLQAP